MKPAAPGAPGRAAKACGDHLQERRRSHADVQHAVEFERCPDFPVFTSSIETLYIRITIQTPAIAVVFVDGRAGIRIASCASATTKAVLRADSPRFQIRIMKSVTLY